MSARKKNHKTRAGDLYTSDLFVKSLRYAETVVKPDKIFILSAKHGLVGLDEVIEPYNETLNDKKKTERKEWAVKVLQDIKNKCDLQSDRFFILAGMKYYEYIINDLPNYKIEMEKLPIGKRLQWLKEALNEWE